MDLIIAFALGAGLVLAAKKGRRALHGAVRWTADAAGWISGRASQALDEARTIAREEFERTRSEGSAQAAVESSGTNGVHTSSQDEAL